MKRTTNRTTNKQQTIEVDPDVLAACARVALEGAETKSQIRALEAAYDAATPDNGISAWRHDVRDPLIERILALA